MIHLDKVTKRYGSKTAVHDLTLEIPAGELFAFLGPNGAGKTTTIKLMCGLLFPSAGTITVGGFDMVRQGDQARRLIAYVPDQPYLYEKLTGREFLEFVGEMYGLSRDVIGQRIAEMIEVFRLEEFIDDLTERYSHGMRQRTVFASALVHQPRVLIVDEPTVGLDPRSVRHLKDLLRQQADQGTTVFLSSHSLDVVQELADRIAIIDHGQLIACGTLEALRTQSSVDGSLEEVFLTMVQEATEGPGAVSRALETAADKRLPLPPTRAPPDPNSTRQSRALREATGERARSKPRSGGGMWGGGSSPHRPPALEQPCSQPSAQARLFQRLRWRLLCNSWRVMAGQSLVRPITILVCSLIIWAFVFVISLFGFRFLQLEVKMLLGGDLIGIIFDLLFLALGIFLLFSSGLILYGSLFNSAETSFLLSKPVSADKVFAYKFQGATAFSSWAFLLLGAPILIAYGLVSKSPWQFYVLLPAFFLGYILIPCSLGGLACLLIVNFVPRHRKQVLILTLGLVAAGVGLWIWSLIKARGHDPPSRESINRLLDRFAFASNSLMPNYWVARGLQRVSAGKLEQSLFYLGLVWVNGLFLYLIAAWFSTFLYRPGFNRLSTGGTLRRRYGGGWLDSLVSRCLGFVKPSTRILLIKDFRTFRRDPQQWAQILIFSGLMLLYILNIRRMFVVDISWKFQNAISLLNLCAVALLLCTYTGRFVYPLLSLEGRKFWILGLLPIQREQLLWGKFAFATAGAVVLSGGLILLSDLMLDMPLQVILLHLLTVGVLSAGLSGMSVGLGAAMPNFRETDPSKIAVGFGGTLNLIACLLYLLVVLALMAMPWHVQMVTAESATSRQPIVWMVGLGAALGIGLGLAAVILPLQLGVQTLRKMEF